MAYRITYEEDETRKQETKASLFKLQLFTAIGLLMSVLLIKMLLPNSRHTIQTIFLPGEQPGGEALAQTLCGGEGLRDGLIHLCRQILEASGHGA